MPNFKKEYFVKHNLKYIKSKKTMTNTNAYQADNQVTLIYNLLFCDNIGLYETHVKQAGIYPWNILFSEKSSEKELYEIINDAKAETRTKILAYKKLNEQNIKPAKKELLAVIVEIGLEDGLDVLASYKDGTARFINHTGKMIFWEATDKTSDTLTAELFQNSENIVKQIGPWENPRRPAPVNGMLRISFLVSDGLYFGEGPIDTLFSDPFANPSLTSATNLLKYLTDKALEKNN